MPIHCSCDPSKADGDYFRWQFWHSWLARVFPLSTSQRWGSIRSGSAEEERAGSEGKGLQERSHEFLLWKFIIERRSHLSLCKDDNPSFSVSLLLSLSLSIICFSLLYGFILLVTLVDMCCQRETAGCQYFHAGPPFTHMQCCVLAMGCFLTK